MAGLLTVDVPNGSLLFRSQLKKGDVIVACNGQSVDNFQELAKILKQDQYKNQVKFAVYCNQKKQVLIIK